MTTETVGGRPETATQTANRAGASVRVEITGMWCDRVRSYVRERIDAGADVHIERRGGRTYVVYDPE